jgi:hypothetical protein
MVRMVMGTRIDLNVGWADYDGLGDKVRIGDRMVPHSVYVTLPGVDGQPRLTMTIDSSSGVPRCTDLRIESVEGGREVRTKDLRAVEVDTWIEAIIPLTMAQVVSEGPGGTNSVVRVPDSNSADFKAAKSTLRQARRVGRRKVNDDLLRRVAEVYESEDRRPAEAVQLAFGVADRTAFRYIAEARKRGLL